MREKWRQKIIQKINPKFKIEKLIGFRSEKENRSHIVSKSERERGERDWELKQQKTNMFAHTKELNWSWCSYNRSINLCNSIFLHLPFTVFFFTVQRFTFYDLLSFLFLLLLLLCVTFLAWNHVPDSVSNNTQPIALPFGVVGFGMAWFVFIIFRFACVRNDLLLCYYNDDCNQKEKMIFFFRVCSCSCLCVFDAESDCRIKRIRIRIRNIIPKYIFP